MTLPSIARAAAAAAVVLLAAGSAHAGAVAGGINFGLLLPAVNLSCGSSGPAAAVAAACDGSVQPVPLALTDFRTQTLSDGSAQMNLIAPIEFLIGDGSVRISHLEIIANSDPFISYSIGVENLLSSTVNYSILWVSPYVGGPYNTANAEVSVTATDGGRDGVTVGLLSPSLVENAVDGVNAGVDLMTSPCTSVCSDSATGPIASGASGTMRPTTRFSVTGGNDKAAITGKFEITNTTVTAPAPATVALLGLGLMALGFARRRR